MRFAWLFPNRLAVFRYELETRAPAPQHVRFTKPGKYTVRVEVTDAHRETEIAYLDLEVLGPQTDAQLLERVDLKMEVTEQDACKTTFCVIGSTQFPELKVDQILLRDEVTGAALVEVNDVALTDAPRKLGCATFARPQTERHAISLSVRKGEATREFDTVHTLGSCADVMDGTLSGGAHDGGTHAVGA